MSDIDEIEKKYGPISAWQKIIILALLVLAGLYEINVGVM